MLVFEWDENKASKNEVRHNVSFAEAIEVFDDPYAQEFVDEAHSTEKETRYAIIGYSSPGCYMWSIPSLKRISFGSFTRE